MGTTQKFLKNFMGFYAIKVLLLAASILAGISSMGTAAEPITIFGVNFDHSPDEAREILEDRFNCEFTYDDERAVTAMGISVCIKDHAMLVELYSSGNYLQSFNIYCEAWDGCIYRFVPESNNHRSLIFKALTQKLGIQPDQTNEFRLTGPLGESVFLDEKFRFQINRTNFRKLQRIEDLDEFSKMFD